MSSAPGFRRGCHVLGNLNIYLVCGGQFVNRSTCYMADGRERWPDGACCDGLYRGTISEEAVRGKPP